MRRRGAFRRRRFRGAASWPQRPSCSARVRFPTFPSQEVGAAAAGRLSRPACTGASLLTPALVCDEVTNLPNAAQSLRGKGPRRRPSGCWETLPRERGRGSQRDASRPDLSARSQVSLQQGRGRAAASSPTWAPTASLPASGSVCSSGRRHRPAPRGADVAATGVVCSQRTDLSPSSGRKSKPSAASCGAASAPAASPTRASSSFASLERETSAAGRGGAAEARFRLCRVPASASF